MLKQKIVLHVDEFPESKSTLPLTNCQLSRAPDAVMHSRSITCFPHHPQTVTTHAFLPCTVIPIEKNLQH